MIATQLKPLLISLLLAIGNYSHYDTQAIIKHETFPKVIVVKDRIEEFCGTKEHLGCYSKSKNLLIIKHLRANNNFDMAVLMHELFHHVQCHNLKWYQKSPNELEKESYAFEDKFFNMLEKGSLIIKTENLGDRLLVSNSFKLRSGKFNISRIKANKSLHD